MGKKYRPRNNNQIKRLECNFGASLRKLFVRNQVLQALQIQANFSGAVTG